MEPMKPAPPVIRILMGVLYKSAVGASRLGYVDLITLDRWVSGELIYEDIVYSFIRLSEDISDPDVPPREKKEALEKLWDALREFVDAGYGELFLPNPSYPLSHWWWHPEIWKEEPDIYEPLRGS